MEIFIERQDGESQEAYSAFKVYLDLQDRNLSDVAKQTGKRLSRIQSWAGKYLWNDRAEIYDLENEYIDSEKANKDFKTMLDIQINIGKMLQAKGAAIFKNQDVPTDKASLALRMIESGVQIERSARKGKRKL